MANLSLQQLAEKLDGKYWEKGDLKRIYLDEGHNTKKMSTKTFVWQDENGEFKVSCKVECPSQPWQWCNSQEEEIKKSVALRINKIIAQSSIELIEYKILEDKSEVDVCIKSEDHPEPTWLTEESFYDEYGNYPAYVFGGKLKSDLEAIYAKNREKSIETKVEISADAKEDAATLQIYAVGEKVKHFKFGIGEVLECNEKIVKVSFNGEVKTMLTPYVKLEKVTDAN